MRRVHPQEEEEEEDELFEEEEDDEDDDAQQRPPPQQQQPKGSSSVILSSGAKELSKRYHLMPPSTCIVKVGSQNRFNVEHHRVQVNFSSRSSYNPPPLPSQQQLIQPQPAALLARLTDEMKQLVFPKVVVAANRREATQSRNIRIVAVGIKAWHVDGEIALGINFEGGGRKQCFPPSIAMGEELNFVYTLPWKGSDPQANEIIFETKPRNYINTKFPDWTDKDAERGVMEMNLRNTQQKMYVLKLPVGDNIPCPLAYFRRLISPTPAKSSGGKREAPVTEYTVDQNEYDRLVEQFKSCVSDSRVNVNTDDFYITVAPLSSLNKSTYKCSLVLDVFYSA